MSHERIGKKKRWLVLPAALLLLSAIWTGIAEQAAHVTPGGPKQDISQVLSKEELTDEDYRLLLEQTGLGQAAVDEMRAEGKTEEILAVQECFFRAVTIECTANTLISREERLGTEWGKARIPYVENGDILITFGCHVFGWRNGHAAIVVDAANRRTLEARVLGSNSQVMSMEHWESYPSFAVLRLKNASKEQREAVALWAVQHLSDIPYRLQAGILSQETQSVTGTQCAHLVWTAYKQFGYDLDSDGGLVVTPKDLYESPELEIIQIYGLPVPVLKKY